MSTSSISPFVYNIAILLTVSVIHSFIMLRWKINDKVAAILNGVIFGVGTVLTMNEPYEFTTGVIFDSRSVILSLGGLFGGNITALVASLIAGGYRLYLGGTGTTSGIITIMIASALGALYRWKIKGNTTRLTLKNLWLFGFFVQVIVLLAFLTLPLNIAIGVLTNVTPVFILVFPITTVLIGAFIIAQENQVTTEKQLKESENKYHALTDSIREMFFSMDSQMRLTYWNKAMSEYMNIPEEEVLGKPLYTVFPHIKNTPLGEFYEEAIRTQKPMSFEHKTTLSGENSYFNISASPYQGGITILAQNTTDQKVRDEIIRKSEEKYRLLFENLLSGFALHEIVLSGDGKPVNYRYLEANNAFARMTELNKDDIVGKFVTELIPGIEDDPADWIGVYGQVALTGEEIRFEQYAESLGKWFAVLAFSPQKGQFATIFEDITRRKKNEKELQNNRAQLQLLSEKLLEVQESERRSIALELHDHIGQILTALKLKLQTQKYSIDEKYHSYIEEDKELVDLILKSVRDMSLDLRPAMLDDLGLVPTLEWYITRLTNDTNVPITLDIPIRDKRYPEKVETVCFRVIQEAITNALRHAKADHIDVSVHEVDTHLQVDIKDRGDGFDVEEAFAKGTKGESLGILGMRERVEILGGNFRIESIPQQGTHIHIQLPINRQG